MEVRTMPELDLEHGDSARAERIAEASERQASGRARRTPKSTARKPASGGRQTAEARVETELRSRLDRTLDRISEGLLTRGDLELSSAIQDDKEPMAHGLVSATRSIKPLRSPLLMVLNLVEPVLAFHRVGGILVRRLIERRARRRAEREEAIREEQMQADNTPPYVVQ